MSYVLVVAGHAGTGKNTLVERMWPRLREFTPNGLSFVDKDTLGAPLVRWAMQRLTGNENDRDSPEYQQHVRALEYQAVTDMAKQQLGLGHSLVLCAPFSRELSSPQAFVTWASAWSPVPTWVVWCDISPDEAFRRITNRAHPMDAYKLAHWSVYAQKRVTPEWLLSDPRVLCVDQQADQSLRVAQWVESHVKVGHPLQSLELAA